MAERGLHALRAAGLDQAVLEQAVMMRGRMVHDRDGATNLQRYGVDDSEVIWSVSRGGLNKLLLDAAERAGAELHFGQALVDADFDAGELSLDDADGQRRPLDSPDHHRRRRRGLGLARGDGTQPPTWASAPRCSATATRNWRSRRAGFLRQRPRVGPGRFAIEPHALHIWPRGGYMCIALPNHEGSFTVTLFLPNVGPHPSFETVPTPTPPRRCSASSSPTRCR